MEINICKVFEQIDLAVKYGLLLCYRKQKLKMYHKHSGWFKLLIYTIYLLFIYLCIHLIIKRLWWCGNQTRTNRIEHEILKCTCHKSREGVSLFFLTWLSCKALEQVHRMNKGAKALTTNGVNLLIKISDFSMGLTGK